MTRCAFHPIHHLLGAIRACASLNLTKNLCALGAGDEAGFDRCSRYRIGKCSANAGRFGGGTENLTAASR
jgi:hypothetical protein